MKKVLFEYTYSGALVSLEHQFGEEFTKPDILNQLNYVKLIGKFISCTVVPL